MGSTSGVQSMLGLDITMSKSSVEEQSPNQGIGIEQKLVKGLPFLHKENIPIINIEDSTSGVQSMHGLDIAASDTAELMGSEGIEVALADAVEAVELATPEGQACGYVCGFIFKKLRHNKCLDCQKAFLTETHEAIHIFTSLKEYKNDDSLYYISKNVIQAVETMSIIINEYLKINAYKPFIKQTIKSALNIP